VQLSVDTHGEGRPVLFVHGLTFDHALLKDASEPLFEHTRARRLYVDLPGHGATASDPAITSAEGLVEVLARFVDTACTEPPIVVGHSYGAYLALGLASVRTLAGVLCVTPVIEPDVSKRRVPERRVVRAEGLAFGDEQATFEQIAVLQTAPILAAYQRLVHPASERTDRAALDAIRTRYVLPWPVVGAIARREVPLPVHLLCGRDDHWVGYEDALTVVRALPKAELEIVSDCGQLLPLEAGERYRAALARMLGP
jgi:pimeloyl-ACP methyl ester carboxylesterase